jgi:two-component system, cell cycle sensor histidine kinase and response regulator CckA
MTADDQVEKMEAIGRVAATMTHNFTNVLMGISGCAEIALSRMKADDPAHSFVEEIRAAAARGILLPKRLLGCFQKNEQTATVIELDAALLELEDMVRTILGDRIELHLSVAATGALVSCDRVTLGQILRDLTVNAREAMSDGGALTIETEKTEAEGDQFVALIVSDTGCGMDEKVQQRAFEPFFTTKAGGDGVGLGLSTVYGNVRQLGGHIQLRSTIGRGTSFRIFLPRV